MKEVDDSQLIQQYRNGCAESFGVLYDKYSKPLYNYFLRLTGSREEANDLLQSLFCKLMEKIDMYQEKGEFKAYLFRMGHNLAMDYLRKSKKELCLLNEKDHFSEKSLNSKKIIEENSYHQDPSHLIDQKEVLEKLKGAIRELPQEQKQVLVMKHYGSLTFKEISQVLSIPLNTALGRMHYAVINLRKQLSDYFSAGGEL